MPGRKAAYLVAYPAEACDDGEEDYEGDEVGYGAHGG